MYCCFFVDLSLSRYKNCSTHKLKQAGWFLRPDFAPSSECPLVRGSVVRIHRMMRMQQFWSAHLCRRLPLHAAMPPVLPLQYCRSTLRSAGGCQNGKLQNVSPPSVLFKSSLIFYNTQETQMQKKWRTRILKFEFCDLWEFFEIFEKASRGPSAADLDHYGRGQTRSE